MKAHNNEITKVQWIDNKQMLLTSAKEKIIKVKKRKRIAFLELFLNNEIPFYMFF